MLNKNRKRRVLVSLPEPHGDWGNVPSCKGKLRWSKTKKKQLRAKANAHYKAGYVKFSLSLDGKESGVERNRKRGCGSQKPFKFFRGKSCHYNNRLQLLFSLLNFEPQYREKT